jgi:L-amino acid N-acyltransferase YncA
MLYRTSTDFVRMPASFSLRTSDTTTLEFRDAPWDERTLGFPCLEITTLTGDVETELKPLLQDFEAEAMRRKAGLAYTRVPADARAQRRTLTEAGFYHAESSFRVSHTNVQRTDAMDRWIRRTAGLRPATPADYPAIADILERAFEHGRFHEDLYVTRELAGLRYKRWLPDLVAQAHEVYAYVAEDQVIGLHVQQRHGDIADLVLTGVKTSHALMGVPLWAEVMRLLRTQGIREAKTLISAANVPIVNLYSRFDFTFQTLLCGYHKHYSR